jgi:hypothetical protein
VHCDVGGGYVQSECRLSDEAFEWMLDETQDPRIGLHLAEPIPRAGSNRPAIVHNEAIATPWYGVAILVNRSQKPPPEAFLPDGPRSTPYPGPVPAPGSNNTQPARPWRPRHNDLPTLARFAVLALLLWFVTAYTGGSAVQGFLDLNPSAAAVAATLDKGIEFDHWQRTLVGTFFDRAAEVSRRLPDAGLWERGWKAMPSADALKSPSLASLNL